LSKELPDVEQGKFDAADGWRIGALIGEQSNWLRY
jgi:hypothetical protein